MFTVYDLKPKFQDMLRPVKETLIEKKVTPNQVTIVALSGSLIVGLFLFCSQYSVKWLYLLPLWLFVRMALNALDGMMARENKMESHEGAVLNEAGDVLSDIFLFLPLVAPDKVAPLVILLFIFMAFATEFCGVVMKSLGAERQYQGPMGKSDRALYIGGLAFFTALVPAVIVLWNTLFVVGIVLCGWTCKNRVVAGLEELKKKKR